MNSFDKYIVSIDLGTSKIALTVATVEGNDVQIIYYRESPSAGIKYSGIFAFCCRADDRSIILREDAPDKCL